MLLLIKKKEFRRKHNHWVKLTEFKTQSKSDSTPKSVKQISSIELERVMVIFLKGIQAMRKKKERQLDFFCRSREKSEKYVVQAVFDDLRSVFRKVGSKTYPFFLY